MVERVRNVIKQDSKKAKRSLPLSDENSEMPPKKRKKGVDLLRRYPVNDSTLGTENSESLEQHNNAILTELKKAKPRDNVLLPLVKSTYGERRMFILNEAVSVSDILEKHPSLTRPAIVSFSLKAIIIPMT